MTRVGIITTFFPYGVGEQFFEPEVLAWAEADDLEVALLPMSSQGPARPVPDTVEVLGGLDLLDTTTRRGNPRQLIKACLDPSVWREVAGLIRRGRLSLRGLAEIVSTEAQVRHLKEGLRRVISETGPFDVIYAYWHGVGAYAAAAAKAEGAPIGRVIARAHRVDLYEDERGSGHHPRKRHYGPLIDGHLAISEHGRNYLVGTFGLPAETVRISRLGCTIDGSRTGISDAGELRIVSISFVSPIKRVLAIHRAVADVARRLPETAVQWTHLGGGVEFDELSDAVESAGPSNLTVDLKGQVAHGALLAFLRDQPIDMLVNFSTSEGVPVSIMEAMSRGVPVVATEVGGVAELVDDAVGALLPADATEDDLAAAIVKQSDRVKRPAVRAAAAESVAARYDSAANFASFIEDASA